MKVAAAAATAALVIGRLHRSIHLHIKSAYISCIKYEVMA
jgi:hypothetical protein